MVAVQLVGRIVDAKRDRADRGSGLEGIRAVEPQQRVTAGREFYTGHAILACGCDHLPADLQRVALITQAAAEFQRWNTGKRTAAILERTANEVEPELR